MVKDLALAALGRRDQVLIEHLQDVLADLGELGLDLVEVFLDQADLSLVALGLLLLRDRGDDAPRGTSRADDVLVRDRQQISLLDREFLAGRRDILHVLHHL